LGKRIPFIGNKLHYHTFGIRLLETGMAQMQQSVGFSTLNWNDGMLEDWNDGK